MAEIVGLHGHRPLVREANGDLVEALRKLLELAEAGEVVGMAGNALHADGLSSQWVHGTVGGSGMIGGCQLVLTQLSLYQLGVVEDEEG